MQDEEAWPVVYISGPITKGSRNLNVYQAYQLHEMLMLSRCAVINPIASTQLPFAWQGNMPHETWMRADLPLVQRADLVVRLPGESVGADAEVKHAEAHGVPVIRYNSPMSKFLSEALAPWRRGWAESSRTQGVGATLSANESLTYRGVRAEVVDVKGRKTRLRLVNSEASA